MTVRVLVALALTLLAIPGAAVAQEPGVNVDPDSPSGKEYAIPLEQARGDAAPTQTGTSQQQSTPSSSAPQSPDSSDKKSDEPADSTKEAVLFGAGVTPASAKSETAALAAAKAADAGSSGDGMSPWVLGLLVAAVGLGIGFGIRALKRSAAK